MNQDLGSAVTPSALSSADFLADCEVDSIRAPTLEAGIVGLGGKEEEIGKMSVEVCLLAAMALAACSIPAMRLEFSKHLT